MASSPSSPSSSAPPYRTRSVVQQTNLRRRQQQEQQGLEQNDDDSGTVVDPTTRSTMTDTIHRSTTTAVDTTNATIASSTTINNTNNNINTNDMDVVTETGTASLETPTSASAATTASTGATTGGGSVGAVRQSTTFTTPRYHYATPNSSNSAAATAAASAMMGTTTTATSSSFRHHANMPTSISSSASYMMGQGLVQAKISPKSSPTAMATSNADSYSSSAAAATGGGSAAATTPAPTTTRLRPTTLSTTSTSMSTGRQDPATGTEASSAATTTNSTTAGGGGTGTAVPNANNVDKDKDEANSSSNNNKNGHSPTVFPPVQVVDGMNITRLRLIVLTSVGIGVHDGTKMVFPHTPVPCPSSATLFFAGILYGKTLSAQDNWLYALALYNTCGGNGGGYGPTSGGGTGGPNGGLQQWSSSSQYSSNTKRLLAWLEKPDDGLLSTHGRGATTTTVGAPRSEDSRRYYWDAVLMAAIAYSNLGDFTAVTQLWIEHCVGSSAGGVGMTGPRPAAGADDNGGGGGNNETLLSPYLSDPKFWAQLQQHRLSSKHPAARQRVIQQYHVLDDDDIDGWYFLGHYVRKDQGYAVPDTSAIHPLSRILCLRANAYKQLGNPQRASLVYLAAFKIDPYCVDAFDGWLDNGGCGATAFTVGDNGEEATAHAKASSHSIPTWTQLSMTLFYVLDGEGGKQIIVDSWLKMFYDAKLSASGMSVGGNAGISASSFMRPSLVPQGPLQEAFNAASSVPPTQPGSAATSAASPNFQDAQEMGASGAPASGDGGSITTPIPPNLAQLQHHLQRQMRPLQHSQEHGDVDDAGGDGPFQAQAATADAQLQQNDTMMTTTTSGGAIMETPASNSGNVFFQDSQPQQQQQQQNELFEHPNLTPIPQQTSMLMMNASAIAGFTECGEPTGGSATAKEEHMETTAVNEVEEANNDKYYSIGVFSENRALDELWNKFKLHRSPEVLAMAAQQSYRRHDLRSTLKYCQALAEMDPLSLSASVPTPSSYLSSTTAAPPAFSSSDAIYKVGFIHVCTLVALNRKRALFRLAHDWVDASPKSSRAWFAVGAYYYACGQYHVAQRHFCRATRLDPHCPEAWIAFGASFSACDESDQALASFRAAQRLAPGHHVSLLYMGMEYLRTNHIVLATHFLLSANRASNMSDALTLSELGVMSCQTSNFKYAASWFLCALALGNRATVPGTDSVTMSFKLNSTKLSLEELAQLLEQVQDDYWESTLFNLAQAYQRERQYDMAVLCIERALALKESAMGYASLGFCLHLKSVSMVAEARLMSRTNRRAFRPGNTPFARNQVLHRAIDAYHQSLAKKPESAFCSEMLQKALTEALEQTDFFIQGDVEEREQKLSSQIMNQGSRRGSTNDYGMSTPSMPPRHHYPQGGRRSMDSTSSSLMSMVGLGGQGRGVYSGRGAPPPPRYSTGDQSEVSMASQWTDDGLSISGVEGANDGDVDMSS